jgi:RNA exonuclease 4
VSDNVSAANTAKKQHDAPMKRRDLYFSLQCDLVGIRHGASAVARVTLLNWEYQVVLDTFVQVPVPVTDYRQTGITPLDLYGNPQAMSFAQARQAVERNLRGKILIGHGVDAHLVALGLTHPCCDVRDTASRFVPPHELDPITGKPVTKGISDLSLEILKRPISEDKRQQPLQNCTAALELYKTFRSEWEQDLIQKARPAEVPVYQPMAPQPIYHQGQRVQQRPHRPRLPSYELPPQAMMLQTGYTPAQTPHSQQVPASNFQTAMQARNSSWFGRGRKQRYPEPSPALNAAALSPQAMHVLSDHGVSNFDHESATSHCEDSSYNEGSIRYAASNDYASSAYTGSLASESFASESVASTQEEQEAYEEASNKENSWFRFRFSSKYSPQQRAEQHLTALEESEESEDSAALTELASYPQNLEQEATESAPYYKPPKYFESGVPGGKSSKSSWFGFRCKSPGRPKRRDSMPKICEPEEPDTPVKELKQLTVDSSPADDTSDAPEEQSFYSDPSPREGRENSEKQPSSWFGFRRSSKSPSRSKSRESSRHGCDLLLPSQDTNPTASSDDTNEDWLRGVMQQPGNGDVKNDRLSDFGSWIEDQQNEGNEVQEVQSSSRDSQSQSTWFRFLRKESTSRQVSRLTGISDAEGSSQNLTGGDNLEYPTQPASSFDESQNDEDWLEEVVAPVDLPAWFGFREAEAPMEVPPILVSKDGSVEQFDYFLRSRLCTESTLQTVASDDIEEEDHRLQDYMENNFNFLNI